VNNWSYFIHQNPINLSDGRTILVPTAWYPRLLHATPKERKKCRLIGRGQGIHWADIDEDISIEGLSPRTEVKSI